MKKAVFFDIDGTLWDRHMKIPPSTIEAVRRLRQQGHYAFLCSGRSRANIQNRDLLGIGFDGVVASCGAHIDFHEEIEYEYILSDEQVARAMKILEKYHMPAVWEGPEYVYVKKGAFQGDPYVDYLRRELKEHLLFANDDPSYYHVNKISAGIGQASIAEIEEEFAPDFDVIFHKGDDIVELIPAGFSKATGIQKVCEILNIKQEDTYGFGDSANDLEMLSHVAHGIAMGNGTQEAKEAAEFVTTDILEDGIKNGLLHYELI